MAIVTENVEIEGRSFVRTYSDIGHYILRDGVKYYEAYDPAEFERLYSEEDEILDNEATVYDYEQSLADLGVRFGD